MTSKARGRALRAIVAALLSSGLSEDDVREVATLLTEDDNFARQFMAIIDAVLTHLPPREVRDGQMRDNQVPKNVKTSRSSPTEPTEDDSYVAEVLRILDSFPMTKKELVAKLQTHPTLADWQPNLRWTRRKIIESFVRRVPHVQLPAVLSVVTVGQGTADPWMEALAKRGNKGSGR